MKGSDMIGNGDKNIKPVSIGIVGQGFVGSALRDGFLDKVQVWAYDKKEPQSVVCYSYKEVLSETFYCYADKWAETLVSRTDGSIFVCVPTPMRDNGECDISIVQNVMRELNDVGKTRTVVIKSTVPPGTTAYLNRWFCNLSIVFNPEFLTEANAVEDFKNQNRIVLGGPPTAMEEVAELYRQCFPGVPILRLRSTEAEMVKYITNCFLAVKVAFANEMWQICDKLHNGDFGPVLYNNVIEAALYDERLGKSHWQVPGPDSHMGFGGSCFPKDLGALIHVAESIGVESQMLWAAWRKNIEVRPERDWEQLKGRAVV